MGVFGWGRSGEVKGGKIVTARQEGVAGSALIGE